MRALLAGAAILVVWAALGAGCAQVLGLYDGYEGADTGPGGSGPSGPCDADSDCDDREPCTQDTCGPDRRCAHAPLPDGPAPAAAQVPGDCRTIVCAHGEHSAAPDDEDVPDDHNDCTVDGCTAGVPTHVPKPLGGGAVACDDGMGNMGTCTAGGDCVLACTADPQCTTTNPCVKPHCDVALGTCAFTPLPDGTPDPEKPPVPGDCHVDVCIGGMSQSLADDSDLPVVSDCDVAACSAGEPAPTHQPEHTGCQSYMGDKLGYCDGGGACVQCTQDSDCAATGATDDCQHPACISFACTQAFTPVNTPTAAQVGGDCQKTICDGAGHAKDVYDSTDPASDGNPCTLDVCASPGATNHPSAPDGTPCGTGMTLACSGGQCAGCTTDSQCAPASCSGTVLAKAQTCDKSTGKCVTLATQDCAPYDCAPGASCPITCNQDADCVVGYYCTGAGGTCLQKAAQGTACAAGHACATNFCVDGVCCNAACTAAGCDACSNAKTGLPSGTCGHVKAGTDPNAACSDQGASTCGTNGSCDGLGACQKYAAGTPCSAASCSNNMLTKQKACNGNGSCAAPTPSKVGCAPYMCVAASNACSTMCTADADCAGGAFCSGGMCLAKLAQGSGCTAAGQCSSGFCVDGVCCNNACGGACQACSAAKQSGADGTCGSAKNGAADPRGICTMSAPSTCGQDGMCSGGACEKWPSGTACQPASCTGSTLTAAKTCGGSGHCDQGGATAPCPNSATCGSATACSTSCGMGSAANDALCGAGSYCDGSTGSCQTKGAAGAACGGDDQCASGACGTNGSGNCCAAACATGGACGATACAAATGACTYPPAMTACGATCAGSMLTPSTCNGMGSCTAGTAAPCPGHLACQSATACATGGCGTADTTGDASCASGYYCDGVGGGACQAQQAAGAACTRPAECASGNCAGGTCS